MSAESKATKDEIQRNRAEAYQGGWDDGYAEGFGKATATLTAQLAEARAALTRLRDGVERLNAACDAMWNDRERLEKNKTRWGQPYLLKEAHVEAITEAQQELPSLLEGSKPIHDATAALSSIKREAEDAGIKIGLRAGAKVAREEAWPEDGTYQPHESNIEDAERGTVEVIEYAILALTPDEARKLGEDE